MLFVVDVDQGSVTTITAEELGISDQGGVTLVRAGVDGRLVAWHGESPQIVTMSWTGTAVRRIPLRLSHGFMAGTWELAAFDGVNQVPVLRQSAYRLGRGGEGEASYRQTVTLALWAQVETWNASGKRQGPSGCTFPFVRTRLGVASRQM